MSRFPDLDYHSRESLLALYHETWSEISRLREYEWKIGYYFLSIALGLIILVFNDAFQGILSTWLQIVITFVQVVTAFFAIYYLEQTHSFLTQQRNFRRRIEEILGYFDKNTYDVESILPSDWKGKRISRHFQRLGLVVPITTMVILVQTLGIYVVWAVPDARH